MARLAVAIDESGQGPEYSDLLDFPDEFANDVIVNLAEDVLLQPSTASPSAAPAAQVSGMLSALLDRWAGQVCKTLGAFQRLRTDVCQGVDAKHLSLVQVIGDPFSQHAELDQYQPDRSVRYVHWDAWSHDGAKQGRFVSVDRGKVKYKDPGWHRRNVHDLSHALDSGRMNFLWPSTGACMFRTADRRFQSDMDEDVLLVENFVLTCWETDSVAHGAELDGFDRALEPCLLCGQRQLSVVCPDGIALPPCQALQCPVCRCHLHAECAEGALRRSISLADAFAHKCESVGVDDLGCLLASFRNCPWLCSLAEDEGESMFCPWCATTVS